MSSVDLGFVVVRLLAGVWLLWSVPRLTVRPGALSTARRDVSVVIPARDEADTLPGLLATIPTDVEVIVVDDHSTDGTAAVAVAGGARTIVSDPLPDGWTGKAWACEQGAAAATGTTLVFVDADVRFGEGGFDAVLDAHGRQGGLLSVQPFHRPDRPAEHLAAIFNVVAFAGTDAASPLGRRAGVRGAFGPVLATSRADHDAVGRHESVRSSVVDDVDLARRYRDLALPVTIRAGAGAVWFRMYPRGFGQMVEGFTKNLASGARSVRPLTALLVLAWLTLAVQASVAPVRAAFGGGEMAWPLGLYALVAAQVWWMARRVGSFRTWVAAAFPLSVVLFLAVFVRSTVATVGGSVSWRGRRVSTRRGPRR
ncbi:glycosyltransferase [Actinospongicola halichondriae]|uniref:glycosyltransferase n=1 Tax=Actinospongicola halichondriae TaxID=3236844 RepID=UPI003D50F9C5